MRVDAADRLEGYQQRALVVLLSFWLFASLLAVVNALASDWPPPPDLPSAAQLRQARDNVWGAAAVSVVPPLLGLVLARRWRSAGWAATFLVGAVLAVLVSAVLFLFTDTPVRPA